MYRVEHLFRSDDRKELLIDGESHYIEGRLEDYHVVSVPEITTEATASEIRHKIEQNIGEPVMVVTHNVCFLTAVRLAPKEAAQLIKQAEDAIVQSLEGMKSE